MVSVGSTAAEVAATQALCKQGLPFSFQGLEGFTGENGRLRDPNGLELRWVQEEYPGSAALEWTLWFENCGQENSARIADVLPLDITVADSPQVRVSYPGGTAARIDDFALQEDLLEETLRYESTGSRQVTPFFHLDFGGHGLLLAVGWTQNWFLELSRQQGRIRIRAGMPRTDFYLKPGEHVRTPRILVMCWQGDKARSYNLLRRHLIVHHIPKDKAGEPYPPMCLNTWGAMKTKNHLRLLDYVKQQGLQYDAYWIDAGWYGEDHDTDEFQNLGVEDWFFHQGNWRVNRLIHPHTLKPVADAAHALGMKLLLWHDLYVCIKGIGWEAEHPEWGKPVGPVGPVGNRESVSYSILNVNHPRAKEWLIHTLLTSMEENGADYYREDPPPLYGGEDEEDRVGVCEMKAVETLYEIWDTLRAHFPDMVIDNCGGGGSRVDLETVSRAYVLWRSDYNCNPQASPVGSQVGNMGLGHFVPLVSCAPPTKPGDDYTFRSGLYGGMGFGLFHACAYENGLTYPPDDYPIEWHREKLKEYRRVKPYFSGDFYSLADCGREETGWCAYEMFRPDREEGVIFAFRRSACKEAALSVTPALGDGVYTLTDGDTGERYRCKAGDSLVLHADRPESCVMLLIGKE